MNSSKLISMKTVLCILASLAFGFPDATGTRAAASDWTR